MERSFTSDKACAEKLDAEDSLQHIRNRFYIPSNTIYFDGNSLGLLSKDAEQSLLTVIDQWKNLGIKGWFEGERPWFYYGEKLGAIAAPLVGATPEEVVVTGTTTVNLHTLVGTFFQPDGTRNKILADELNFPSDIYALESQIKLRGLDPDTHLVLVSPNGNFLNEEKIVDMMTDEIALIMLPSALYRSGQLLDLEYLTEEAHKRNIPIGFDCSHSVGAVPHYFDKWNVDFAFWCSYKYMNSGPGGTAFLYLNKRHFNKEPALAGWFGYKKEKQFEMLLDFDPANSAGGWQISSSGILCAATLWGALAITLEAGIENIRKKSINLTSYLMFLVDEILSSNPYNFKIGTPRDPHKRTGHVALEHEHAEEIMKILMDKKGIVTDYRPPNVIRVAPVALYNTYQEIWQFVHILKAIIDRNEYQ
jgi:kynureninase